MNQGFWPTAPFYIPFSTGMPNWWDMVWWLFQLGIMALFLWLLYAVAVGVDKDFLHTKDEDDER